MIEPRRARVPLNLEVPWEIADLVAAHGPALIQLAEFALLHAPALLELLQENVLQRHRVVSADIVAKSETEATCNAQIAEWRCLAADCLAEIGRRSNGPGQHRSIIKQLAAERGVTPQFLQTIIKVHGKASGADAHSIPEPVAASELRLAP